jgi:hypothetical protein
MCQEEMKLLFGVLRRMSYHGDAYHSLLVTLRDPREESTMRCGVVLLKHIEIGPEAD